jgi:hypothetical protein
MKKTFMILLAIFMAGALLFMFTPTSSAAGPAAADLKVPAKLQATAVKIPASSVRAAIERAHGPLVVMCPGARAALAAYNACKQRCADAAAHAPLTPADLEMCGNMTAAQCADVIIARRAQACINQPMPAGCGDEYAKLQRENYECKKCAELRTQAAAAINDVRAKAAVVARLEAQLAAARAQLSAADRRMHAIVAARDRMCAAAQR